MNEAWLLLELAGEAALLLWGLHMVQSGVMRAYGSRLRQRLGSGLSNRRRGCRGGAGRHGARCNPAPPPRS